MRWQFCPQCGKELEGGWSYCPTCGVAIGCLTGSLSYPVTVSPIYPVATFPQNKIWQTGQQISNQPNTQPASWPNGTIIVGMQAQS